MASNTRRGKTKLDSSLSEEKLLKENKYFDLSFDDLKNLNLIWGLKMLWIPKCQKKCIYSKPKKTWSNTLKKF